MKKTLAVIFGSAIAVLSFATGASANTGQVHVSQNCDVWSASVTLNGDVTSDHFVEVTSTIPGTTNIVDGHYKTTPPEQGGGTIWSFSGKAPQSGTVTLTILNPNRTVDSQTSASLPPVEGCEVTTTTQPPETVTTFFNPTTTTHVDTTTTAATTTTTGPNGTTTTVPPVPTTACTPGIPPCAYTGSNTTPKLLLGGGLLVTGSTLMAFRKRRTA